MNPYADYRAANLFDFLSHYQLTRDIGEKYEYSNLAVGLLGTALARQAGVSYEEMVQRRILEPLGMTDTSITLSDSQKKRLATGHNRGLEPAPNWDWDALAGAGALRSTANDLLKFMAANLELTDTPLKAAMRRMRQVHRETGTPELEIQMAWHVWHRFGTDITWHNGETSGYHSFAGMDPKKKSAVVVLCNTAFDIDDLGRHILESQWPASPLPAYKGPTEITLSPEVLQRYVGEYQFAPGVVFKVTRDGARLFVQMTGQPALRLYASAETEFFLKVLDAQVTFVKDEGGAFSSLVAHQGGTDQKASRIAVGR